MIYKGIISSLSSDKKKARVFIPEKNYVSAELEIAYAGDTQPNDSVIAAFTGDNMVFGFIIANLTRQSSPTGDMTYIHNQISPSAAWTITHNLGKYPSVTIIDSAGNEVIGDIQYIDNNTVRISFTAAFAGTAYLN